MSASILLINVEFMFVIDMRSYWVKFEKTGNLNYRVTVETIRQVVPDGRMEIVRWMHPGNHCNLPNTDAAVEYLTESTKFFSQQSNWNKSNQST